MVTTMDLQVGSGLYLWKLEQRISSFISSENQMQDLQERESRWFFSCLVTLSIEAWFQSDSPHPSFLTEESFLRLSEE